MGGIIAAAAQAGKASADVGMSFGQDTWWIMGIVGTIALGVIAFFLKRTISKQDKHGDDIEHIKLTYVTKDDLKEVKANFKDSTDKLQHDVEAIKDTCLTKRDYIERQAQTEARLNQIYDLLLKGGGQK